MSEFLFAYGLFIAKVITALIALILVIGIIGGVRRRDDEPQLQVTGMNQKYQQLANQVRAAVLDKKSMKTYLKEQKDEKKTSYKKEKATDKQQRMFVLDFDGDIKASEVTTLRDEITSVIAVADTGDEVLLRLDNAGGMVHEHGLAASQLQRIRDAKIRLTVSVDKVAASGGYLMACVADKIVAAPFAIIGSIGVLAQLPNFNRLLDKAGIDFEQHTAGKYKRTVTMFGKNSDQERDKLKLDLQETHTLFQEFVKKHRPKLEIDKVATGEHWYGSQALKLKLIDEIKTSDQLIIEALDEFEIFHIKMEAKKRLQDKLLGGLLSTARAAYGHFADQQNRSRYS